MLINCYYILCINLAQNEEELTSCYHPNTQHIKCGTPAEIAKLSRLPFSVSHPSLHPPVLISFYCRCFFPLVAENSCTGSCVFAFLERHYHWGKRSPHIPPRVSCDTGTVEWPSFNQGDKASPLIKYASCSMQLRKVCAPGLKHTAYTAGGPKSCPLKKERKKKKTQGHCYRLSSILTWSHTVKF